MILSKTPDFTICGTETCPLAKTIAFGGVAMGNINAQLEASVMGIMRERTGLPSPKAIPAMTGRNTVTKATLLMSSVMKRTNMINAMVIIVAVQWLSLIHI